MQRHKNFFLLTVIIITSIFTTPLFAEIKTTRTATTDILIPYHQHSPVFTSKFLACEIPYLTSEKLLYFDIHIPFNYTIHSPVPNELRTESYSRNSMLSIGAFFVVNRFGIGIKIDFNPIKEISERYLRYDNGTTVQTYNIKEKKTRFNVDAWLGYRILDNLGVGFDLYYRTYYKTHNNSYVEIPGTPIPVDSYWNIAEEKLFLGPSVIYQPFSFLNVTYAARIIFKRRLESHIYEKQDFTNFENLLKLTFYPVPDVLIVYIHAMFSFPIGNNYDMVSSTSFTYTREQIINTTLFADWWFIKNVMYFRAGGFFENIYREAGLRSSIKPHNTMYEFMFGFQLGYGYKVNEKFMFTIDFILRRFKYQLRGTTSATMEWFDRYNTYEIYISTRYSL